MFPKRFFLNILKQHKRKFATSAKPSVEGDSKMLTNIENATYKPRQHPGIIKPKTVPLPPHILKAIETVIQDHPIKNLLTDSAALARHLKGRVPAMEGDQLKETKTKLLERVLVKEKDTEINNDSDELQFKQRVKDKVDKLLKEKVYNWSPVNYDAYNCLLYLLARSAPEFAVLTKIFAEIHARDPDYKPKSLFDFGSGVGTVTWAAKSYWKNSIFEHFNVDISGNMNDLAQTILQGGHCNSGNNLKGVFYRQFLPANNLAYDLVVSAYSMLELASFQMRMETILRLWNKTNKYLVVVEQGTNAGFKVINEIRDFILRLSNEKNVVTVFSPCPHEKPCPRFLVDNTPCNFQVGYHRILVRDARIEKERYSYVVLKKGAKNSVEDEWPRLVRETLIRSKHSICRMCTANGKLEEVIFTASKHGKSMYHCARSTKWGDRLPVSISESDVDK